VVSCEQDPRRVETLQRHADLVLGDAARDISTPADLADVRRRHAGFGAMKQYGPVGNIGTAKA
jgi:uncharacterized membrane protein